jgi:hypothetical protein
MAKVKYDGVLEAAHFKPDGQLDWVRVYERHGVVFSDRILLGRQAFIEQLEKRKRFVVGKRIQYMGGKFDVSRPVHLLKQDGKEIIVVGEAQVDKDTLTGVPII